MSQYHYMLIHESKNTEVLRGWDRPLQGFFLVIDQGGYEPLWSNLYQKVSHPKTLEPFLKELQSRGINLPTAMILEMEQDKNENAGNKCVVYWGSNGDKRIQVEENKSFDELCLMFLSDDNAQEFYDLLYSIGRQEDLYVISPSNSELSNTYNPVLNRDHKKLFDTTVVATSGAGKGGV